MINYKPKKCQKCGSMFKPISPVTKYCMQCKTFICQHCGKEFVIRADYIATRKTKFCSIGCYLESRWGKGICPICKIEKPTMGNRYCSQKCRKQANRQSEIRGSKKKHQRYVSIKNQLFAYLGNKCQLCGFDNVLALDIHHPKKQKKNWKHNQNRWVRYWHERDTVQLICANCHRITHHS
jgi:hypothetical protein